MLNADGTSTKLRKSINEPGDAHALTFSCYKKLPLLSKDRTRQWAVGVLDAARGKFEFELWAFVIMPDHIHVLLLPRRDDYRMPDIFKAIKQPIALRAIAYLKEHHPRYLEHLKTQTSDGKIEHRFWQAGGGYDRNVANDRLVWNMVNYIHENPVRRNLDDTQTDWRWSSSRCYAGMDDVVLAVDGCPQGSTIG